MDKTLLDNNLSTELLQTITVEQAWHYRIIPIKGQNGTLKFFIDEEMDVYEFKQEIELIFDKDVELFPAKKEEISKALGKHYLRKKGGSKTSNGKLSFTNEEFLAQLISEAKSIGSSDIHIESYEERCRIRMRIDGKLIERYALVKDEYPAIVNKIKIKANLDIAEKRLPQDGRIFYSEEHDKTDLRVSVLPTLHGEKVVLRLLNRDATEIDISLLGFSKQQESNYLEAIKKPYGIILISGPTGSGKTTTLYATLKILNKVQINILTIEDPIEYTLEGINQVQLKEDIGLSFASTLRTFLRQDPDIIMLGEIRDGETAQMAIRASLTGHLVLSTVHTNTAWGIVSRIIDMGVPPFLLANTLNLAVAQRLVRLLCPNCKEKKPFSKSQYPINFKPKTEVTKQYKAMGCETCFYTGYSGREAVFEVIPINESLMEKIKNQEFDLEQYMKEKKIVSLRDSAFYLFQSGKTTIEEIYPLLMSS